ncbi:MAG: response regulator [Phycisphaerae bacterium]|nr:response regulator [Phycisphaerae bacterium]
MRGQDDLDERAAVAAALDSKVCSGWRVKTVYTTGEVAEICNISQQTVIRCFDDGRLRGFRVPGSKFRRIPRDALLEFMKSNGIPLDHLDSGKTRVLVVDDDAAIVEMLEDLLTRDGRFDVKSATNGFDAGALTQEFKPDILLLDYMLPDINGNVVCERVRKDPSLARTKIIIVSGAVSEAEVEQLKQAGADDFIKKPFDVDTLITRMVELLQA